MLGEMGIVEGLGFVAADEEPTAKAEEEDVIALEVVARL